MITLKRLLTFWSLEFFEILSMYYWWHYNFCTFPMQIAEKSLCITFIRLAYPDINDSCPSFVFLAVSVVLSAYRWASYTKMWSTWEWVSSFFENSIYGIIKVIFLSFLRTYLVRLGKVKYEKATKFERNLPPVLTKQILHSLVSKRVGGFFKLCAFFRKATLYSDIRRG